MNSNRILNIVLAAYVGAIFTFVFAPILFSVIFHSILNVFQQSHLVAFLLNGT